MSLANALIHNQAEMIKSKIFPSTLESNFKRFYK